MTTPIEPVTELSLTLLVLALAIIGGALAFEHWGGLTPCEVCLAERWPWYGAIPLAAFFLVRPRHEIVVPVLFGLLFLGSAGLALYHVGVEQHVIAGPTACTAGTLTGATIDDMRMALMAAPAVRCDEVQWDLFGVSLAGWNFLASLLAAGLSLRAWFRLKRRTRS